MAISVLPKSCLIRSRIRQNAGDNRVSGPRSGERGYILELLNLEAEEKLLFPAGQVQPAVTAGGNPSCYHASGGEDAGKVQDGEVVTFSDEVLDDAMAAILRNKTPAQRLAIAFRLWTFAQRTIEQTTRRQHPDWDDAAVQRHVARRMSHGAV